MTEWPLAVALRTTLRRNVDVEADVERKGILVNSLKGETSHDARQKSRLVAKNQSNNNHEQNKTNMSKLCTTQQFVDVNEKS